MNEKAGGDIYIYIRVEDVDKASVIVSSRMWMMMMMMMLMIIG